MIDDQYWAHRRCLREPIPEIEVSAELLTEALNAHERGDETSASRLIEAADLDVVRQWAVSLMGPEPAEGMPDPYRRIRQVAGSPPILPKESRIKVRMPSASEKAKLIQRDGHVCVFCGIPLIRSEVRQAMTRRYPEVARWGAGFDDCHAALLCMWLQFDHILPHSRGGDNQIDNIVVTCAACNYGRMARTLDEVGLFDPRGRARTITVWDGLERASSW